MTIEIKLPPEFRSGNSIPVERATITRERMVEILTAAIEADRQARGEPASNLSDEEILEIMKPGELMTSITRRFYEDEWSERDIDTTKLLEKSRALIAKYAAPQPQQIPKGDRQILRDFFAALDKANALDKSSSTWVTRPKGSTGERLQAWAEVNRLRTMLEAAPEPKGKA